MYNLQLRKCSRKCIIYLHAVEILVQQHKVLITERLHYIRINMGTTRATFVLSVSGNPYFSSYKVHEKLHPMKSSRKSYT